MGGKGGAEGDGREGDFSGKEVCFRHSLKSKFVPGVSYIYNYNVYIIYKKRKIVSLTNTGGKKSLFPANTGEGRSCFW